MFLDYNNGKAPDIRRVFTTYYVYSGPNPIMEYSASDSKYTYYIFAGTKSVAEETNGMKTFYHRDHLGSTRALTDQNGKLVGLCKYDAWGKIESTNEYDAGVINGDFELNDGSGNVLKWASVNDNPILADCTYTLTGGINGSPGIKITRNSSGDTAYWARQNLFVSPDTDYVLTGNFLSGTAQSAKAHAQLVYYDAQGNILKIDDTGQLGYTGTWKAFALSSHSPANAATMEIRLTEDGDQGMAVFFDGLRLKVPGLAGKYDFTGKKEDEDTGGLLYFGARWYDPESCRFTTMDPAKSGQNWMIYCRSNPLKLYDPDGEAEKSAITATVTKSVTFHPSYNGVTLGIVAEDNGDYLGAICLTASGLTVNVFGTMTATMSQNTMIVSVDISADAFCTNMDMGITVSISATISVTAYGSSFGDFGSPIGVKSFNIGMMDAAFGGPVFGRDMALNKSVDRTFTLPSLSCVDFGQYTLDVTLTLDIGVFGTENITAPLSFSDNAAGLNFDFGWSPSY